MSGEAHAVDDKVMKTYQVQTTVTTTTIQTVTADSEEAAIATGETTGGDTQKQVSVNKTAIEVKSSSPSASSPS